MIDEIRKIKIMQIQERLNEKEIIQRLIESNSVEIKKISDTFDSKRNDLINENCKLQSRLFELEKLEEEKARIKSATLSDFGISFQEAVKLLQERGIKVVLTEEDKKGIYDTKNQEKTEINSFKDLIFVHKTDYPPKNSQIKPSSESDVQYEDEIEINGEKYSFKYNAARETVHGYMNGEVGSHTGGYWDNMKYVILIPFDKVDKGNLVGGKMVDTYFKGAVNIPEGSYILCPIGEKEEILKNNPNVEVIEYEGERALDYGDALVSALGYYEDGQMKDCWSNEKCEQQAINLYKENGFRIATHAGSKEQLEELNKTKIAKKIGACEILRKHLKEISSKEELYKTKFSYSNINKDNLKGLFERLEEIDVKINKEDKELIRNLYVKDINRKEFIDIIKQRHPDLIDKVSSEETFSSIYFSPEKCEEIVDHLIIKEIGKERIKEIREQKIQEVLGKEIRNFELEYDEEKKEFISKNATEEEREIYNQLQSNIVDKINQKLVEKGINSYIFRNDLDKLNIIGLTGDGIEEIDNTLQGKQHYQGIDELGLPSLDFEKKDEETLKEFLERLEKYAECFSRYFDGKNVDESVRFDENGDIIEETIVEKASNNVDLGTSEKQQSIIKSAEKAIEESTRTEMVNEQTQTIKARQQERKQHVEKDNNDIRFR